MRFLVLLSMLLAAVAGFDPPAAEAQEGRRAKDGRCLRRGRCKESKPRQKVRRDVDIPADPEPEDVPDDEEPTEDPPARVQEDEPAEDEPEAPPPPPPRRQKKRPPPQAEDDENPLQMRSKRAKPAKTEQVAETTEPDPTETADDGGGGGGGASPDTGGDVIEVLDGSGGDTGGDVVEVLDGGAPTPTVTSSSDLSSSGSPDNEETYLLRGWNKTAALTGLKGQGGVLPSVALPYDRYSGTEHLYLQFNYRRGKGFEAVASGLLAYSLALREQQGIVGSAPMPDENNGPRGIFEPALREAFIGFYTQHVDVRIGQQRIPWGNTDGARPNDILNARDLRDRVQNENEIIEIPTLAIRTDLAIGTDTTFQIVVAPFFTPDKLDLYGTNWAIIQNDADPLYKAFVKNISERELFTIDDGVQGEANLVKSAVGLAFKTVVSGIDISLYYHFGFDRNAYIKFDELLRSNLEATALDQLDDSKDQAARDRKVNGLLDGAEDDPPFSTEYHRRHHFGADAQTVVGPFVVKFDGALDTNMVFAGDRLTSHESPVLQAVGAIEYQPGDIGKLILLEVQYLHMYYPKMTDPRIAPQAEQLAVTGKFQWKWGNWLVDFAGIQSIRPNYTLVRPEFGWSRNNLSFRVGAVYLMGAPYTLGGTYRESSTGYASVKYQF